MRGLDYYKTLGISERATNDEIRRAYKKLSLELHPDRISHKGGSEDERKKATGDFQNLQSAYQILSDSEKREAYDREGSASGVLKFIRAPQDLERPSVSWSRLNKMYEEIYHQHPLEKVKKEDRVAVLKTMIPLNNGHFSALFYQSLYVLTRQNEQGSDIDEQFSDVFALIEEKQRRFGEPLLIENDLKLTLEQALIGLLDFLKGKYYGFNLIKFQTKLEAEIQKNPDAKGFYSAILKLISVKNLEKDYPSALSAIHDLNDAALEHYKIIERQSALLAQIEAKAQEEYQQQSAKAQSAKEQLERAEKICEALNLKVIQSHEALDALEKEIQESKINVANSGTPTSEQELKFEQFENKHYHLRQVIDVTDEAYANAKITMHNARSVFSEQLKLVEPLEKRLQELGSHQEKLQAQKFNERFLDLIESKYYKMTLASIVSHYWQDATPHVTSEKFSQIASRFSVIPQELRQKYTALGQTLLHADERIKKIAHDLTVDQCWEHAEFFFDLSVTVPVLAVKVSAMMLAGLCWQMAARQSDCPSQQMALEASSLRMYQLTLKLAAKLPASHALYVMIHVPKYLSELQYDQSTMGKADIQTLVANMQSRHDRISPAQYEYYTVHGGSALESMEGAMDRALYLLSYFPIYSAPTHLLDQLPRQRCYMALQEQLLERFATKQQSRDHQEPIRSEEAELYYYVYQKLLKTSHRSDTAAQLNELRLLTMTLLLEQSKTSLVELDQLMNAPYVSMPQDDDGFWTTGPLNYPDDPDSLNLVIYKSFDGYSLNPKTGDIQLLLTRWIPGDKPEEQLFTHDDLLALIKGGVGRAIFSLDANSVYRQYDPLQVVRFSPQSLKDTEYLRSLFATDYIMKMASQGTEINAKPPYNTRPINTLFEGLDESIQKELLVCTEVGSKKDDPKSHATRFWIQMGAIPRAEKERGYCLLVRYGDPDVAIKKQLLTIDAQGHLIDAPIDLKDESQEARFAAAFTKHYGKIAENLPVFNQLKAFYTISGAIQELQKKRLFNTLALEAYQHQLDDPKHWQQEKDKKRKEWQEIDWDDYLVQRIALFTKLVKDDAHWERLIEDAVKSLERKRISLENEQGEEYQQMRAHLLEMHQALAEKIYEGEPRLRWTLVHPDFKQHCDTIRQTIFEQIKAEDKDASMEVMQNSLDLFLNPNKEFATSEEAILHKLKADAKKELLENLVFFKDAMGDTPYHEATVKFLQGDIMPMVRMQAEYDVSKMLVNEESNPEMVLHKQNILDETKNELLKQLSIDRPTILDQVITKSVYAVDDPVFVVFYNKIRGDMRQHQIQENQPKIPNWQQFEAQYLAQIDSLLDRDFSKQSQLVEFNKLVARIQQQKKMKWVMQTLSEFPTILTQFEGEVGRVEAAVQELFDGHPESLAHAHVEMVFQELKTTVNSVDIKTPAGKKIWEQLLVKEIEVQSKRMAAELKTIISRPKEEHRCPDYGYLKPYFAEQAYQEAMDSFTQGNASAFVESQIAFAFKQRKKELSGDLYLKAKQEVDEARKDLESNIPTKAKQHVDSLKAALTNNMEAQLESYIEGAKESLSDAIVDGKRLEASFLRMGLGKPEELDASSHTEFRVPAVFSKRDDGYVYGGVNAIPSFNAIQRFDDESKKLTFVSSESDIWSAKRTLADIDFGCNSLSLSVMFARQRLEHSIRMAEWQLAQDKKSDFGVCRFNLADRCQLEIQQSTMTRLEKAPETPRTSLFSWRVAGAAFQTAAQITLSNVVSNTTAVIKGTAQGLGDNFDMFAHPIDNVLKPAAQLAADTLVIATTHLPPLATIEEFCQPHEMEALKEVCRVITENRQLYDNAVMNMENRLQNVQQGLLAFSGASEAEQHRMAARAITAFVSPGVLMKAASGVKNVVKRAGLSDSPMLLGGGGGHGAGNGGGSGGNGSRKAFVLANIRESQKAREASKFGTFAQRSTALEFYAANGFSSVRANEHMRGIDFSQPVEVVTLPKGTEVVQYKLPGAPVGNYFSPSEAAGSRLGVYTSGRQRISFFATREVRALKSKTAGMVDEYSMAEYGWQIETQGGETQYFTPDNSAWQMK